MVKMEWNNPPNSRTGAGEISVWHTNADLSIDKRETALFHK